MVSDVQRQLLALCAIRVDRTSPDWNLLARNAQSPGDLAVLMSGHIREESTTAAETLPVLRAGLHDLAPAFERVDAELAMAEHVGASLTTVLDDDYPPNLRLVANLPPFLFHLGRLAADDARSVAVVGTRSASAEGLAAADRLATELAAHDVTVVSGLARGIDTAAHRAALRAGGRTIAIIGTGITRCYPPENRGLTEEIAERGAVASQFWPTSPPGRHTFPRRNVVTSGISQGTVVIEASSTSGAKMQARLAAAHGKQVFLVRRLVTHQEWARKMVERGVARQVESVDDVLDRLAPADRIERVSAQRQQLTLDVL